MKKPGNFVLLQEPRKLDPLGILGGGGGQTIIVPPAPPPPAPTTVTAEARLRADREAADDLARKKGRQASVLTGPEGVGATPIQVKTLVGS